MPWDFVVSVCTVIGGVSASIAIYQFFKENIPKVYAEKRWFEKFVPRKVLPSSASAQDYLQFKQEVQEQSEQEEVESYGKLLIYTSRAQFGKEVHICEQRRWVLHVIRPVESTIVQCFQHRVNKHRLFVALLEVPTGSYIVWIGKAQPVAFFKRPTAVSVFPGKLTELFLR